MVKSIINPEVNYKEARKLETIDIKYHAPVYHIDMYGITVRISIGQLNKQFEQRGILYVPIYLIYKKKVKLQIGVYELEKSAFDDMTDEDGDLRIETLTPLLYTFIMNKPDVLNSFNIANETPTNDDDDDDDEEEEKDDKSSNSNGEGNINPVTKAKNWISVYMDDEDYKIISTKPNGDCFFLSIVKALKTIDVHTTVKDLRKQLADEVDPTILDNYKSRYNELRGSIQKELIVLKELKKQMKINKELSQKLIKKDRNKVMNELQPKQEAMLAQYKQIRSEVKQTEILLDDVLFMKKITSELDLKGIMKTQTYYADTWALATMERLLNIKFIVMSGDNFDDEDLDNIIVCTEGDSEISRRKTFSPDHYIPIEHKSTHYQNIFYKDKGALTFDELDDQLVTKIVDKCMETTAGVFHYIDDFKQIYEKTKHLQTNNGNAVSEQAATAAAAADADAVDADLDVSTTYNPDITLRLYDKAGKYSVGKKGSGDIVPEGNMNDFKKISTMENWRRKLSNYYCEKDGHFKYDDKTWASVEHLYQASKFKKNNVKFYNAFSLDSNTQMSKEPKLAIAAGTSGSYNKTQLRPQDVKEDPDFKDKNKPYPGYSPALEEAQTAKIQKIPELKEMLLATNNAKLIHFVKSKEAIVYNELMMVRSKLS